MKREVVLSLIGRQTYMGQEPDEIELVTDGSLKKLPNGWELSYEESALTGLEGVQTTFLLEDGCVTLTRTGKLHSQMIFQEGQSHDSLYRMDFGALLMTVRATSVFFDIVPDGGVIDLCYEIEIEHSAAGLIEYHLDIRAK